ncbi:MAG: GAF domain-containing protein [Acidobacteria bacterium]|nr:GAF domain-containing protein [Acidobacteriota bacterium]
MPRQVCYFTDSPAASLAAGLPDSFAPRALDRGEPPPELAETTVVWLADWKRDAKDVERFVARNHRWRVVYVVSARTKQAQADGYVFALLPSKVPPAILERTLASAFQNIELAERLARAETEVQRSRQEIAELNRIGVALSAERDTQKLLELILRASRQITRADAGSLYLVEEVSETEKRLRFKLTQNDSIEVGFTEFTMAIDRRSIAGYVADTGEVLHLEDAYELPPEAPFGFNRRFDEETGYRTKSMLTIPMKNQQGDTLGVLQLINCKRDFRARLTSPEVVEREVVPFEARVQELALSLASQAAVAYENNVLYENIQTLFEGFVKAAVTAIEQRDPTTSGHSFRVSRLTCGLAETVDRLDTGPFAEVRFTPEQLKEIRYAALLHDFGKVGVREQVLVKAKKLYPHQMEIIQQRFDYVRKSVEADYLQRKLEALHRGQPPESLKQLDQEFELRLAELDDYLQFVLQVNEPTVLPAGNFERLLDIAKRTYVDARGVERTYVTPEEIRFLSIPKGSLDPEERLQIESHVIHTFNFLAQIPWTREIKNIPLIARAHHEKLDGSGYPYKLREPQIPLQTKMMTISDIFDALSASDRPYKKAVPIEKALDILASDVKHGALDPILFQLFVDAKIFQLTAKGK